ncbi:hypothetical protein CO083_03775 [Candidatus Roizmanbacteria bacterium CG_4_9_14_0_8_um_filter_34_12]|uniref:HTH merR-type domain-containing protein n=5 Tax=Candidatus Roizmaniibacteriota TaxID=1752723 RepID=A0A2M7LS80_9BACT|nr:MAG: hypothetical protein COZ39_04185 [Candidatus Roizmanbacteria bacterium CG_4_10_14_3_um_filter_33_21]PJB88053.1 MAG: hypothetical protein CO083_03775 [Candidatus Roizmanbacteria bacterium CG_4_9_14_0_8_um_filter_34_12]
MLLTKAFAEICDTTKKTIIYYDRIGILKPQVRKNNFRYYQPKQALIFQKITLLKSFNLTLKEIKLYIRRNDLLINLFANQVKTLEQQKNILEKRINKAKEFSNSLKNQNLLVTPKIKTINLYWIYALKKQGRYVDIASHQREVFQLAEDKYYHFPGITIFHNHGYSPHDSKMTTGVYLGDTQPQPKPKLQIITVPEHKTVSYIHIGSYSYMSYVWQFVDQYVIEHKLKCHPDLDCREIYWRGSLAEKNEENLVTELQVPIL